MEDSWFVARTKPGGEKLARENFGRQGFRCFLPLEECQQKRGRRQVVLHRPLFPSYIFVALNLNRPGWTAVNSTYGVVRLVAKANGLPTAVPDAAVEELIARTDEYGCLLPPEEIAIGSEMRIVKGPFANWVAEVEDAPDETRVRLLFDLMGRKVRVTTTRSNLATP